VNVNKVIVYTNSRASQPRGLTIQGIGLPKEKNTDRTSHNRAKSCLQKASAVTTSPVVAVSDLDVSYRTFRGYLKAVENVSLTLETAKIHALVGESGCGKSTLGLSLSRLLPEKRVIYSGKIVCKGTDLLTLHEKDVERFRGTEIATVFQEPMTSLNPVYKIGEQMAEALGVKRHRDAIYNRSLPKPQMSERLLGVSDDSIISRFRRRKLYQQFAGQVDELLNKVKIPNPERVANMYPHELSGGMKQRVMIAMAIAEKPSLLVADEPTTALDVTTQTRILELINSLTQEYGMSVLLIAHDLGVVAAVADYISVMYAGKIVEEAPKKELFENPLHPYTIGLMGAFPKGRKDESTLKTIPGVVPQLGRYPSGCRFHPRCEKAFDKCPTSIPRLIEVKANHKVACYLHGD
jgi:peptide/nickel transport system ATP-binding protein